MTVATNNSSREGAAKVWLLNVLGNAAALSVGYFWLVIPDARGWQVAGSAVLALLVVFLVAWLRAGTFAYFRVAEFREPGEVGGAFRRGLRHVIPLMILAAMFALLAWCLWSLYLYTPQFGVWLRQKMGGGVSPRAVTRVADWLITAVLCVLMPAVWLPVASTVSAFGVQAARIKRSWRVLKQTRYWLWLVILLALGGYVSYRLVWWVPQFETIKAQAWSMGLRFLAAYLIAVTAWVAVNRMVGVFVEREDTESASS